MTLGFISFSDHLNETEDAANLLLLTTMSEIAFDIIGILVASGVLFRRFQGYQTEKITIKRDLRIQDLLRLQENVNLRQIEQNATFKVSIIFSNFKQRHALSHDSKLYHF